MHVKNFIRENPTTWLEKLVADYKIDVVPDAEGLGLVSLKYNQQESPMDNPIVCECRGMVVETGPQPKILAHPYNKFWNHGEHRAAPIDWTSARVPEKLDGSLMIVYFHPAMGWRVASSGNPVAGGSFGRGNTSTFAETFWNLFAELGMQIPHVFKHVTFMFELCHPQHRIVVRHEKPRIVLHGARDLFSGREIARRLQEDIAHLCRWEIVKEHPIRSIEDALVAVNELDPIATEGFIVVDADFHRIKIKNPRYVILHHMKGEANPSPRRAIELWQTGETNELLSHFPELSEDVLPVHGDLEKIAQLAHDDIMNYGGASSRKDFALAIKDRPWSSVLFRLYQDFTMNGKPSCVDDAIAVMRNLNLSALERMREAVAQ